MNKDLVIRLEKEDTSFFLCKILKPGYLDNIKGTYITILYLKKKQIFLIKNFFD